MKKLILIAISVSLFACNKSKPEDPLTPPIEDTTGTHKNKILFPLTVSNEWYYDVPILWEERDTFRISSDITMSDIQIVQNTYGVPVKNTELALEHNWVKFLNLRKDINELGYTNIDSNTINVLTYDESLTLVSSPFFKIVNTDTMIYHGIYNGISTYRYAYAQPEMVNGYEAYKIHEYCFAINMSNPDDTTFSTIYYIARDIGIVRMEKRSGIITYDLTGYSFK